MANIITADRAWTIAQNSGPAFDSYLTQIYGEIKNSAEMGYYEMQFPDMDNITMAEKVKKCLIENGYKVEDKNQKGQEPCTVVSWRL